MGSSTDDASSTPGPGAPSGRLPSDAPTAPDPDPLLGQEIDKYRVVKLIGRGGMGSVYEALNTRIQKRVALKFIESRLAKNVEVVARFHREALAASAIDSPHIVQIFDSGVTGDGTPYIVMELLPGQDLGRHLRAIGRLELGAALHVVAQILKALGRAHAAGIVHRDLKPDNVFLVEREGDASAVKLLDFGVSKIASREGVPLETLTQQGTVVGTPHYMSPEQAQAMPDVDRRTDIYSVGAILYECLAGRPPHVGRSYEQVIVHICTRDVEDVRTAAPEVPEAVSAVIARSLARDREQRYASAAEFLDALVEATPEELRDKYLKPLLGLDKISLRPASSSSSSRKRADPALTPAEQLAATTPVGRLREVDGLAETVRAQSSPGVRSAEPATLPAAGLRPRLSPRLALIGAAALAGAVVLFVVLRNPGSNASPPAPAPSAQAAGGAPSGAATTSVAADPGLAATRPEPTASALSPAETAASADATAKATAVPASKGAPQAKPSSSPSAKATAAPTSSLTIWGKQP
jgi:eukaryotic-like serine/threonine-protein kinase